MENNCEKRKIKKCSYFNCEKTSADVNRVFFLFRPRTYKEWIKLCGNDALSKYAVSTLCRFFYICDIHFEKTSFKFCLSNFPKQLKLDALPIEFNSSIRLNSKGKLLNQPRAYLGS